MREEVIGSARLILGDCRDWLQGAQADLVLTDPPYGVAYDYGRPHRSKRPYVKGGEVLKRETTTVHAFSRVEGDDQPFDPAPLLRFRNAVLWGANNYAERLPASTCWFSWDKKCGRAAASEIGDCELAWVRGLPYKTVRAFRHMWAGFQRDSQVGEVRHHPTEKPIALFAWCLGFFPAAATVVDPYMGAGASGIAAVKMGRTYFGAEIEPRYFDTACRRIEDATRQADLFIPPVAVNTQHQGDMLTLPTRTAG